LEPESITRSEPLTPAVLAASYDSSIVVRRWVGAWIDFSVLAAMLLIPDAVLGNELYQTFLPVWLLMLLAYFPVTEGLTGRSLGKLVTSTVVVDARGGRPGLFKACLRTVLRLVEVNPLLMGGAPAGLIVLASKHRQRLGDMVAGTYVLKSKDLPKLAA